MQTLCILLGTVSIFITTPVLAQMQHGHGGHGEPAPEAEIAMPTSPGQEAFGAIAEIISLLSADPSTDWQKVNIPALQAHLQDMDELVMLRGVVGLSVPGGLQMTIPLTGNGGEAAGRMLPAHGPVLEAETGWLATLQQNTDHLIWTVTSTDSDDVVKIRALGFIGLMATGWHHQTHHLAIARGQPVH